MRSASGSLKKSGDIGDAWDEVDGSTGDDHSWLSREGLGHGGVDLLGGDGVNFLAVLVESQVSEGLEVASNLFESLVLSFHGHEHVHLEDVLGAGQLNVWDWLAESVEFLKEDIHELSRVRSWALNGHAEETGVSEVRVDGRGGVNKVVLLHQVGDSAAVHSLSWATRAESGGGSDESVGDVESWDVGVCPGHRLEGQGDVGAWALSPGAVLSSNVLGSLTSVVLLWNSEHISEALLDEVNVLTMVLDTTGDDQALLWSDVLHDELLEDAGVKVLNVALKSHAWHAESPVTVGGSEEHLLDVCKWVVLGQVVVELEALGVLGASDVCSHDGSWLEGTVDHHLEHVDSVVLDAVTTEVGSLLVVLHLHVTTRHLNHSVVDSLVGVLQRLKVGVFEGEEGT